MSELIGDDFRLAGELDLENAEVYKARGLELIDAANGPVQVDLGGLTRANSVTVAVLLGWYRHAVLTGKAIDFVNLPDDLRNIVEFSGLQEVLPAGAPGSRGQA